ncbi:MAG TPA: M48 family metallopeptidase [Candidatus Woesebacteria bacterium]|nr:M48 family metallopeptidase [Candidatus Woesebacteria bacterium]
MINVYQQVSRNKIRSFLIISLFIGFISFAAYIIAYSYDLAELFPLALLFSFGSSFLSYYYGDKIVLALNQAKVATRKDYFDFYTVTENLCLAAQIPTPKIYVIDTPAMNAFATGRNPQNAVVCATTGLLSKLDRTELEGVIAHELSHIKNYDILLMTTVSLLIGTLSILIDLAHHSTFNRKNNKESSSSILTLIGIILIIFAPLIGQLIQLAISRQREFFADAQSALLTRQPSGLISALKKISSDPNIFETASTATASLYITNPFTKNKIANLFSTHPPVEDRIKALEGMI